MIKLGTITRYELGFQKKRDGVYFIDNLGCLLGQRSQLSFRNSFLKVTKVLMKA